MSKSKGGLGRGLAALIPTGPATDTVSRVFLSPSDADRAADKATGQPADKDSGRAADSDRAIADQTSAPGTGADRAGDNKAGDKAGADRAGRDKTGADKDGDKAAGGDNAADRAAAVAADGQGPNFRELPIDAIRPNSRNPRTVFDEEALAELEHSLREFGLLQPIVVRPVDDGFELIMGERRWRAAQQAGFTTIGAIVRRTEDADMLRDALLENIHRANLNPLEEAAAYQQLLQEFAVTQEELASRLGRSRPVISNTIRLLKLPVVVQRRVAAGVLSAGHARALLGLESADAQEELAARIVAEGLSVRGTEEAVVLMAGAKPKAKRPAPRKLVAPGLNTLAEKLADTFDTRVKVELGRKKGQVVIEFATVDDLNRIISLMAPQVMPAKP